MQDKYKLLNKKNIINILIGDTKLGKYKLSNGDIIEISMPYLSGPNICDIAQELGCILEYSWNGGTKSRWEYFKILFEYCIGEDKCELLLTYLFQKGQFSQILSGYTVTEFDDAYDYCVSRIIETINGMLHMGGNKLCVENNRYVLRAIRENVTIHAPMIKTISYEEIDALSKQAMSCIERGDFQGALTKARTILEDTFAYVIRQKGEEPGKKGDINNLYKTVRVLYKMHTDKSIDKRINTLLSGLEKIVESIRDMRNEYGDAHGKGIPKLKVERHHARLCVNAATAMAEFILSVYIKSKNEK